jgi:hypothetical protein
MVRRIWDPTKALVVVRTGMENAEDLVVVY